MCVRNVRMHACMYAQVSGHGMYVRMHEAGKLRSVEKKGARHAIRAGSSRQVMRQQRAQRQEEER